MESDDQPKSDPLLDEGDDQLRKLLYMRLGGCQIDCS